MSQFTVEYPKEFPVDGIREIIRIVRGRTVSQEKAALAQHLWIVQGYVQGKVFGGADLDVVGAAEAPTEEAALATLEEMLASHDGHATTAFPVPMFLLVYLVRKLLELITEE